MLHALQLRWFDRWLKDDTDAEVTGAPIRFQAIGSQPWFQAQDYPFPEAMPTRLLSGRGRAPRRRTGR